MTKILKLLLGLATGAAVGYFGVQLIIWLSGAEPAVESNTDGVDYGLLALSVGLAVLWLAVSFLIHIVFHEAGHLVMGLITGYRFISFRVFNFTLVKTDNGLRWKRFHISGTGGQCLLDLPEDVDWRTASWFWYNAGGVLMNLILAALSIILLRLFTFGIVGFSFLIMMAIVGLAVALLNGIPMMMGGLSNDGHNLLTLFRRPEQRRFFVRTLQMAGALSRGIRLRDMPGEWLEDLPVDRSSSYLEITNRIAFMTLLEDRDRLAEACTVGDEILALGNRLPGLFRLEVSGERVMVELLTENRSDVVNQMWSKQLARYTEQNYNYSPMKCAVLYSVELLHRHNQEKADTYRDHLLAHANDYTMPGEALTALDLVECARERSSEIQ